VFAKNAPTENDGSQQRVSADTSGKYNGQYNHILMAKLHILRDYNRLNDAQLGDFALHIAAKLTGNINFTTPPVTPAALTTAANGFATAIAAAVNGTPQDTVHKNVLRTQLIALLDQLADYVELTALGNQEKMLSAGLNTTSGTRALAVVGATGILGVTNIASTKLALKLLVADNAWAYIVEVSSTPGVWVHNNTFTDPRDVTLTGLTPGTTYAIRVRPIGSKNQYGEWCAPVSHMST
jgi:hypothetical protein